MFVGKMIVTSSENCNFCTNTCFSLFKSFDTDCRERKGNCSDFLIELYVKGNFIPITAIASGMRDRRKMAR